MDAERLRRVIVTYATVAMVMVGIVVAALAITPLALRLRADAQAGLRHELSLKVMAAGEVVRRATNMAQQVTSRTVIRQKLESYNRGEITLGELRDFTTDKLADALNLSPELLGIQRYAADGQLVAALGQAPGTETMGPLKTPELSLALTNGKDGPILVVCAPIVTRSGSLAGTDLVVVSAGSLHAIIDEARTLRGRTQAALIDMDATSRVRLSSQQGFALDVLDVTLVADAVQSPQVLLREHHGLIATAAVLPGTRWVLLLRLPAAEVTANVDTLALWVALATAVFIAIGVLGLRKVLQPLTGVFIVHATDMSRQIAEMQRAQDELAAKSHDLALSNAELQEYTYAASHDLQEPVRTIIGFAQLLSRRYRGQMGPEADEFIDFIVEGAERMRRQINDLLTYARLGRSEQVFASVDMNQLVAQVCQDLHGAIEGSGAEITIGALPAVHGGADALARLMQNLIGNALKFTKPGQPPRISLTATLTNDRWAEFCLADQGIGIAADYHERVFRMFERLHPRGQYEGSGIGLAICRKVIELHGGRIWLDSCPDQGTTFHFTLPLA